MIFSLRSVTSPVQSTSACNPVVVDGLNNVCSNLGVLYTFGTYSDYRTRDALVPSNLCFRTVRNIRNALLLY